MFFVLLVSLSLIEIICFFHPRNNCDKVCRHSPLLSLQKQLIVASGYQGQSLSVFPESDIVVARFGLTTDDSSWDLASLLEDVLNVL